MAALLDLVTETIECGPLYGDASILQLAAPAFNHVCSSGEEQGRAVDSTGLRIHAGLHVTARLLLAYPSLLAGKRVVELGCGTGALGLVTTRAGALTAALALTDGSELSVQVAERNVAAFGAGAGGVSVHLLPWGASPHVAEVLRSSSHKSVFDVAIGCELLYYSTDVEALVDTVMQVTNLPFSLFPLRSSHIPPAADGRARRLCARAHLPAQGHRRGTHRRAGAARLALAAGASGGLRRGRGTGVRTSAF
jgi:predicted nicotinamide N-methyase